jgi:hypothetical protein
MLRIEAQRVESVHGLRKCLEVSGLFQVEYVAGID